MIMIKVDEQLFLAVFANPTSDIEQVVHELCRLCDYAAALRRSRRGM